MNLGAITKGTVASFVPAHADSYSFSHTKTRFGVRKILINIGRAEDLRIRNAFGFREPSMPRAPIAPFWLPAHPTLPT